MKLTMKPAAAPAAKSKSSVTKPKPTRRVSDKEIGFMWLLGQLDGLVAKTNAPDSPMKDELNAIAGGRDLKDTHFETICRHARKRLERLHTPVLALMKKRGLVE
jgi:hypothetical protein